MKWKTFLSSLVTLALVGSLGAQIVPRGWIGDDGFNVGCCNPVQQVNVPQFPAFKLGGTYACIKDCDLEAEFDVRVSTQHIQIACDLAIIPFSVTPGAAGGPGWAGTLIAKYARTWVESDLANPENDIQVWRWLVNTDAFPTSGAAPCPIPPHPAGILTHFTGHIDYACAVDAAGNLDFRMAMNLNHLPGCISHNQFSASPLLPPPFADGHHDRSYHLVAPAPFTFAPVSFPEGPTPGEAVRSTLLAPLPYTCLGEAQIEGGNLIPQLQNCLCPGVVPAGPFGWIHQSLDGIAVCPTPVGPGIFPYVSLPIGPPAPPLPTGFVTFPLGSWVGADTFPGPRELNFHFGLLQYQDPCNPNDLFHIVTGVSTRSLDPLRQAFVFGGFNPGPYEWFTDLEDMILANGLFGPYSLGFGTFFLSKVVWNLNLF